MRAQPTSSVFPKPYWDYEDIGIFFLILVLLTPAFRLLVRFQVLRQTDLANPTANVQFCVVAFLSVALYSVLKLRHHRPVLRPLGWVWPRPVYAVAALVLGVSSASGVALCLHIHSQSPRLVPEILLLRFVLGPVLEESLFRGCVLPLLAQNTGDIAAVMLTAILFALFHGPNDLAHWVSFAATGLGYGCLRLASRSTTAAALMHASYNLMLVAVTNH